MRHDDIRNGVVRGHTGSSRAACEVLGELNDLRVRVCPTFERSVGLRRPLCPPLRAHPNIPAFASTFEDIVGALAPFDDSEDDR